MTSNRNEIRKLKSGIPRKQAAILTGEMTRLMAKCARQRGNSTEKYVAEALDALLKEGRIASFYVTKKWSRQDRRGIDAVIYLNDGTEVRRQIKSSVSGIEKHLKQQEKHGGEEIGALYGSYLPGETFAEYRERIFKEIAGDFREEENI